MKPEDLNISNYQDLVKDFHDESDRGAAVLAGAFIESYLANYIKSHLVEDAPIKTLFEGFGPMATYSQRREIAYSFGLISTHQYEDLKYIGKIRNRFAHHPLQATFEEDRVASWCRELSLFKVVGEVHKDSDDSTKNRNHI